MINKPAPDAIESDLVKFIDNWVKLCADGNITEAFSLLDAPIDKSRHRWTPEDIKDITYNHFDDEQYPAITDPDKVAGDIRIDIFEYTDGSGWGVEYSLPLNGIVSDFTLMFDFIKDNDSLKIIMDDCHIM